MKPYNSVYEGSRSERIAFPLGGIGSGSFCLEGTGALSHFSLRHLPDLVNDPLLFSAVHVKSGGASVARLLEGPVPRWKVFNSFGEDFAGGGSGQFGSSFGLPRFAASIFRNRFPFGVIELDDQEIPLQVEISGWSPFIPLHADDSSLPVAALEYKFTNRTDEPIELVYSFHAAQFMKTRDSDNHRVLRAQSGQGFVLDQPPREDKPWEQGAFSAFTDQPQAAVDCAWFRGGWFDSLTMVWEHIAAGRASGKQPISEGLPSPGGSIYVPLALHPGEQKTVRLMLSWFVPDSNVAEGQIDEKRYRHEGNGQSASKYYKPWYAGRFTDISAVSEYWLRHYSRLREESQRFTDTFYAAAAPDEVIEAIAANLCILKSPTVLRQTDGRLWAWEGCRDKGGSCYGTCTHVWNYAQAIPHLFPELERGIRDTEFEEGQDERGHQNFRVPLPIQPSTHDFHAASDGQLGGIMKVYREWRISGNLEWLQSIWPKVKQSLHYCIRTWDPDGIGVLIEPHHNTYDIEFWGADGMCSSIYLGALKAASRIAQAVGENTADYDTLYRKGRAYLENELFNGEYFEQKIIWEGLRAASPLEDPSWTVGFSPEAVELLKQQGPKYQYGKGCLSDGIIGAWFAEMCGLGDILDREKVASHLLSVCKYNLKHDLTGHVNPQRPGYAVGKEGGLLLCTWPRGGELTLPFVYSNEVWTGIEYQVASHLMSLGYVEEGLRIVKICRDRYDGVTRNPFNEYECGHWYARALASYGLLQGWSGIRYDACEKVLYVTPRIAGDYSSFLCTNSGYGIAGVRDGKPFISVKSGTIEVERIAFIEP